MAISQTMKFIVFTLLIVLMMSITDASPQNRRSDLLDSFDRVERSFSKFTSGILIKYL